MKVATIDIGGTVRIHEMDNITYDFLSQAVDGMIEAVAVLVNGIECTLWCNEEGKLEGYLPNLVADEFHVWKIPGDVIVGDVVITGGYDDEGETLGIDEATVQYLTNTYPMC